jgi:hypothetical protein
MVRNGNVNKRIWEGISMHRCPQCNSERIRRSKRSGFVERIPLTALFLKPFRCGDCKHRFFRLPMVGAGLALLKRSLPSQIGTPPHQRRVRVARFD